MFRTLILLYFLLPFFSVSQAEKNPSFQLVKFISCEASYILTDNIGNIYTIGAYEIKKYKASGELQFTYSNKSTGEITQVDVSNPLNIIVYYRDFNQLLFLDNTLSPIGDVYALIEHSLDQVSLVCGSRDNGIWLYDQQKFQLLRMDKNFEIIQQSGYINQLTRIEIHPIYMLEYNNQLYLNDANIGILVFDIYGAYVKTIPFKGIKSFQVAGDRLYYLSGSHLKSYDMKTMEEQSISLPETNAYAVRMEGTTLILLANGHMTIYTLIN